MRILLIEDDEKLSLAMEIHLKKAGYAVDSCADGSDGLALGLQNSYDLILLDRMLPSLDGLMVLTKLRQGKICTPVLMVTALDAIGDKVDGLDAGADDYLAKPFDDKELLARVRALLRRTPQLEMESAIQIQDAELDIHKLQLSGPLGSTGLSKKETELMGQFFKNYQKTLSRTFLFTHVWGPLAESEDSNLDTYIHFLRRRLRAVTRDLQIITVRGVGYRLEDRHD